MSFDVHEALLPAITYDDFVLMAQNCNPEYTTLRDEVRKLLAQRRNELWEMFLEHEEDIMRAAFPERFPIELTFKGKHVYTRSDFHGYGELAVFDLVDGEVIQDLMDLLPLLTIVPVLRKLGNRVIPSVQTMANIILHTPPSGLLPWRESTKCGNTVATVSKVGRQSN